ncbi:MAG: hypothetical protein JWO57_3576 [Pseudonocardiales bacterium]|nr:hypothetical protein [Pseudonocardiales bacterium]
MTTATRGRIRIEQSAKRVRGYLGGHVVVDSVRPVLVWESPYYPTYYFPISDVSAELAPDGTAHSPSRGEGRTYTVSAGERRVPEAAVRYAESPIEELQSLIRFEWAALDAWFEEDEEVIVHPRDPHTRVDILASSRHVRVEIDGVTVAESRNPRLLFETGLPVRYYLPKTDVRFDLLEHTDTVTQCPYKGTAEYWTVRVDDRVHPDVVWSYPAPLPESQKVTGLVAFYNEKVDIFVDGVLQDRPKSPFS